MVNRNFIFLLLSISLATFAITNAYAQVSNETVSITTQISPITILSNEVMPLLDTSVIGNLTSLSITANLPCDSNDNPKVKIVAGILGNTTNVIESSGDSIGNGPRDTCLFTDSITNVTESGIPSINRVFLNHTGSNPVHIPQGVMVTLTGIFDVPSIEEIIPAGLCASSTADVCDDLTTDNGFTTTVGGGDDVFYDSTDEDISVSLTDMTDAEAVHIDVQDADWLNGANIDDDKFVLRFTVDEDTDSGSSSNGNRLVVGFGDTANWESKTTSSDWIAWSFIMNHASITDGRNRICSTSDAVGCEVQTLKDGEINTWAMPFGVEVIRDGTSLVGNIYTDGTFTTTQGTQLSGTITGSVTNLRYFSVQNEELPSSASTWTGSVDEVQIWNGVASVP